DLAGELEAVDGVDQRDATGDQAHLVALQAADEVPAQHRRRRRGELGVLGGELLRVVLAEVGRARGARLADRRGRVGLGHRDDRDVTGEPTGALAYRGDARGDIAPALGDGHAGNPAVNR